MTRYGRDKKRFGFTTEQYGLKTRKRLPETRIRPEHEFRPLRINTVGHEAKHWIGFGKKKMSQFMELLHMQHKTIPHSRKIIQPNAQTILALKTDGSGSVDTINIVTGERVGIERRQEEEWITEITQVPVPVLIVKSMVAYATGGYLCATGTDFAGPWVYLEDETGQWPLEFNKYMQMRKSPDYEEEWAFENTDRMTDPDSYGYSKPREYYDTWVYPNNEAYACQMVTVSTTPEPDYGGPFYDTWMGYHLDGHGSKMRDEFWNRPPDEGGFKIWEGIVDDQDLGDAEYFDCFALDPDDPMPATIYATLSEGYQRGDSIGEVVSHYGTASNDWIALVTKQYYDQSWKIYNFYKNPFLFIPPAQKAIWIAAGGVWPDVYPSVSEWVGAWDNPWTYEISLEDTETYEDKNLYLLSGVDGASQVLLASYSSGLITSADTHIWDYGEKRIATFTYKVSTEAKVRFGMVYEGNIYTLWLDPWYEQTGSYIYYKTAKTEAGGVPLSVIGKLPDRDYVSDIRIAIFRKTIKRRIL